MSNATCRSVADSVASMAETLRESVGHRFGLDYWSLFFWHLSPPEPWCPATLQAHSDISYIARSCGICIIAYIHT